MLARVGVTLRLLHVLLWFAIALAIFMVALTVFNWGGDTVDDNDLRGTAVAQSCERIGPVSRFGFGRHWECRADVRWDNGTASRSTARKSQLTPADIGRPVRVVEERTRGGRVGILTTPASGGKQAVATVLSAMVVCVGIGTALFGVTRLVPKREREKIGREVEAERAARAEAEAQRAERAAKLRGFTSNGDQ